MPESQPFPLPKDAAIERFRTRVKLSIEALLPGSTLPDVVVAGYIVEAAHSVLRDGMARLRNDIENVRAQAADLGTLRPLIPTVVGVVTRKADHTQRAVANLVNEVTRVYEGMEGILGVVASDDAGDADIPDASVLATDEEVGTKEEATFEHTKTDE